MSDYISYENPDGELISYGKSIKNVSWYAEAGLNRGSLSDMANETINAYLDMYEMYVGTYNGLAVKALSDALFAMKNEIYRKHCI